MDEDRKSARHEAAHAFAGWSCGARLNSVTIGGPVAENTPKDERSPCYCNLSHPGMVALHRLSEEDILLRLCVSLAPYAFHMIQGEEPGIGARLDIINFLKFVVWGRGNGTEIGRICKAAESILERNPDDLEKQADEFFEEFGELALQLLHEPGSIDRIEVLAEEILRKTRLSGFEAATILERVGNLRPEKAKPAQEHSCGLSGTSPANALEAVGRLLRMCLDILSDAPVLEDQLCEESRKIILQALFHLGELTSAGEGP